MKKYLCFIIIIFSMGNELIAQKYQPILDSINVWSYTGTQMGVKIAINDSTPCYYPQYYGNSSRQYTYSDTSINGFLYKKLYSSMWVNNPGYTSCLFGWVREDTTAKKIYFRDVNSVETVLYDFSMQLGDSMNIKFNSDGPYSYFKSGFYTLDSIKTVKINSKWRRQFDLNCKTCIYPKTLSWVEGIGNLGDFVYSYSTNSIYGGLFVGCYYNGFPYDFSQLLTCFEHKRKVYYDSCAMKWAQMDGCIDYRDSCNYGNKCSGLEELNPIGTINISPNPAQKILNINLNLDISVMVELNVFEITGKHVGDCVKIGRLNAGISSASLNVSSLQNGIYFLECKTDKGALFEKFIIQK